MSDYFDSSSNRIVAGSLAQSSEVNAIRDEVGVGFDKLPPAANVKTNTSDFATDTGTANAYAVAMPITQTAYTTGMCVSFKPAHANTAASTLNVDSLGVKPIKRPDGTDVVSGDILTAQIVELRYNGTNFVFTGSVPVSFYNTASSNATAAASSASAASTSETNAATSASNASSSASSAASSASAASTSATNAASSASAASTSETNAASSASDAASTLATFQGQYHGPSASAPTSGVDVGDLYFDTSDSSLYVCTGTGPDTWAVINNYTHPTYAGDDIDVDTTALTGATVISDLDFNVTTDTKGHITDANGSVATRTLTVADLDKVIASGGIDWNFSVSGGTASEPADMLWTDANNSNNIIKASLTWTSNNVTKAIYRYSTNAGSSYSTVATETIAYDSADNVTTITWT